MSLKHNKYQSVINWLFKQFPSYQKIGQKAYKPTLKNIEKILQAIGNPQKELKFIHIAGTNGKGSSCSILASIITEAGYKTGLFTSPHILDFRERIRINGKKISEKEVIAFIEKIQQIKFDFQPSFFEITFAMSLDYFKKNHCDICVIETGLGGRLDATNIIQPIVSGITNISLEHTNILGNTIKNIAKEKGGIIKKHTPVVLGVMAEKAKKILITIASEKEAEIIETKAPSTPFRLPLLGEHQKHNFNFVLKIIEQLEEKGFEISNKAIEEGLEQLQKNTGFIGRLQIVSTSPVIIFDVAHNPEGIQQSLAAIQEMNYDNLHLVIGFSQDKNVNEMIQIIPENITVYFTEFNNLRSMDIENVKKFVLQKDFKQMFFYKEAKFAYQKATDNAKEKDLILVTGSFFLLSDILN